MSLKSIIKKILPDKAWKLITRRFNDFEIYRYSHYKKKAYDRRRYDRGINLIGPVTCDSGLGQSSRLLAEEIRLSDIPFSLTSFVSSNQLSSTNHDFDRYITNSQSYGINIFHINMHEIPIGVRKLGLNILNYHYNIAYWLWEVEKFPDEWIPLITQMDEIWTPSEFSSNSIRKVTKKPVITVPYHVMAPVNGKLNRSDFGLPENMFLFLMMFDKSSVAERKNPRAVIEAFKKAFEEIRSSIQDQNQIKETQLSVENQNQIKEPALVIKISNATEEDFHALQTELKGYHVFFIKDILSKEDVNRLIQLCDVYVSLHRSEGYGLVLAEAMLLGTPTIATAYSSNVEFQTETSACLVKYKLKKIGKDIIPYHASDVWAEPDISDASNYMKRLYSDSEFYRSIKAEGLKTIQEKTDMSRIQNIIQERMDNIYR